MKSNEDIKHLLDYLQSKEEKALVFDEEAIASVYQKEDDHQSLAIKIVSVFGGVLSSIAFLGFLFITGLYDSGIGLLIFGILCIVSSIWISKVYDKIIMDTLSVSSFAMGFFLLAFGMVELEMRENTVSIIFIVVALLSLSIVQNYILSCSAILIINGSILTLIISNNGYDLVHIYVSALAFIISYLFLKESKIITMNNLLSKLYNPARIGLILSFLAGLVILGKKGLLPLSHNYIWLSSVVIICAIIFLISIILEILSITAMRSKMYTYISSILLLLPTALSPAISGSLLIILLCFLVNHKSGLMVGIIAFIYFISQYYYDLNLTLLTKSILLFSTGVMFIVLYLFTHKKLTSNE